MSTQTTISGVALTVPEAYDLVPPAPYDTPGTASFTRTTPGAICHVELAPVSAGSELPLDDKQALVGRIHDGIDDDQGLIEVGNGTTAAGHPYVYSILRTNLDHGVMRYGLTLQLRSDDTVVGVRAGFDTEGVSSYRDSLVLSKLTEQTEGWFQDPYDPNFALGSVMNLSELPKYDPDFPDHPLTLMRAFVRDFVAQN